MNSENLICLATGFAFGVAVFLGFSILRVKLRDRRLRHIPRGTVLFRP